MGLGLIQVLCELEGEPHCHLHGRYRDGGEKLPAVIFPTCAESPPGNKTHLKGSRTGGGAKTSFESLDPTMSEATFSLNFPVFALSWGSVTSHL